MKREQLIAELIEVGFLLVLIAVSILLSNI